MNLLLMCSTCSPGIMDIKIVETALRKDASGIISSGSYTTYRIQGKDSLGEIDIERRYREFLLFRGFLFQRYPGLYVPPIPGKNLQGGNTKESFVEERKHYLNRFITGLCK